MSVGLRLLYALVVIVGIGYFLLDLELFAARKLCEYLCGDLRVSLADSLKASGEIILARS